jgi:membrane-associated phospholipid phosphatase
VVLVVSVVFGYIKRVLRRVVAYAALAAATLFLSEDVAKPLVHRVWQGLLTFPSGHVTAVSATALAMWLALLPVLGTRARSVTFALGTAWTVLMFVAVVGARWHTPVDGVGSLLLSVGTVTAGAVVLESFLPPGRSKGMPTTSRSRATHPRTPKALTTRKR